MPSPPNISASTHTGQARFRRLRRGVTLFGVLVLLAFAGASAYDVWRSYHHTVTATNREISNVANALAAQTAGTWQAVDLLLLDTARWYRDDAHQIPESDLDSVLAARTTGARQVRLVTIADAQGIQHHRSQGHSPPNLDVSDRPYFIAQRDHPDTGLFMSEPLMTRSTGRYAIVLSRRLEDTRGQFAGVVTAIVDLEDLQRFYATVDLGLGTSTYLLGQDGTLLVRNPPAPTHIGQKFPALAAAASAPVSGFLNPVDGNREFVAVAGVRETPLKVAVTRDHQLALRPWTGESISVAIRTIGLTLLGALTLVAVLRQLRHIEAGECALRASEERYALALEGANEGHWDWDVVTDRMFLSPKMKTLQGQPVDSEITTRAVWLSKVVIHPDDKPVFDAAITDHLQGRTPRFECEYRTRQPNGAWCWLLSRGRCLFDEAGQPLRFVGSAIDITSEKQAQMDKERLEAQLRQSQKMEAIGTLAGGIAHDFNNILGAILGYGELAHQHAAEGSAIRRYLDNVMHAAGRAKTLVDRILGFSRSGMGERVPVNIQFIVEETLELLEASLPEGIRLEKQLDAGDAAVIGDTTRLHQVAMNLCTNAMQAMAGAGVGTLSVVLERVQLTGPRTVARGTLAPRDYVRLVVADTGKGIPPEVFERIFDPFFTTKGVGEGTGLGLSLVHGIVSDLGGGIDVASKVGAGTRFEIWLPVAGETHKPAAEEERELPHANGEMVMIVDDERPLVALTEEMLARIGYEPVGFDSSAAALRAFEAQPQRFDVILTDEAMPELTGTDLAREIRRLRPEVPIVLMSGYGGTQLTARAASHGVTEVLRKPLQSRELAETLARVLELAHEPP
jgi:PAS domain S-box-containing protein